MEARRSAENIQRLPALLAAALPVTDVTALQMLPENGNALSRQRPAAQLAPADRAWMQTLLENAVQQSADKVLEAQVLPVIHSVGCDASTDWSLRIPFLPDWSGGIFTTVKEGLADHIVMFK